MACSNYPTELPDALAGAPFASFVTEAFRATSLSSDWCLGTLGRTYFYNAVSLCSVLRAMPDYLVIWHHLINKVSLPAFSLWVRDARWLLGVAASFLQSMPCGKGEVPQPSFEEEIGHPSWLAWGMVKVFFFSHTTDFRPVFCVWHNFSLQEVGGFKADI